MWTVLILQKNHYHYWPNNSRDYPPRYFLNHADFHSLNIHPNGLDRRDLDEYLAKLIRKTSLNVNLLSLHTQRIYRSSTVISPINILKRLFRKKIIKKEEILFPDTFLAVKKLNIKMIAIQCLTQDYAIKTMPQTIALTATTACNLKCPHCQTHGTKEVNKIYNKKRWSDDVLDKISKATLPTAMNFGLTLSGEPLCIPKLGEKLKKFSLYGAKLNLTTNGTLLTKKSLCDILPIIESISISIDGATQLTCETLRSGSNFKRLLNNIQILSRIRDTHFAGKKPHLQLAFTSMVSNIRDMPEIIRLAHALKIPIVTFFPVIVFFPHMNGEDLNHYKSLYRAYYLKTKKEMEQLNIAGYLPDLYPDITPDPTLPVDRSSLLIKEFPDNYYENLPPVKTLLDNDAIEKTVQEIGDSFSQYDKELVPLAKEVFTPEERAQFGSMFKRDHQRNKPFIERYQQESTQEPVKGKTIRYCKYLYTTVFIDEAGFVAPCCIPGRPNFGNIFDTPFTDIWNGEAYNRFRKDFYSNNPPECCKDCIIPTDEPLELITTQAAISF